MECLNRTFIKSQKKQSLVILNGKIYFNNSIGDISAVDVNSGNLIWQTPTQSSSIYESAFLLKTSDLVANNESIMLSNNKNEFFSINANTGVLNWKQKINSNLRPSIIDNFIDCYLSIGSENAKAYKACGGNKKKIFHVP